MIVKVITEKALAELLEAEGHARLRAQGLAEHHLVSINLVAYLYLNDSEMWLDSDGDLRVQKGIIKRTFSLGADVPPCVVNQYIDIALPRL